MSKRFTVVGVFLLAAALAVAAGASGKTGGGASSTPGVSARQIVIGGTFPLSGPASGYAPIPRGMSAYFSYINSRSAKDGRRGVYGRQITFKYLDDGYNPAQTVQLTQQLVQQDHIFADVGALGTEPNLAIRQYLNQQKVPQLYVSTGDTTWGTAYKQYPYTIGWQPDYQSEGLAYGQFIAKYKPLAKIAVLFQNDSYGKDYLTGFKRGLGSKQSRIVSSVGYEVTEPTIASEVAKLKASGANTLMIFATPKFTIQALVVAYKLGWRPDKYVNSVSATDTFLTIATAAAGSPDAVNGVVSDTYLKDPGSPKYAKDSTILLYRRLMKKFLPGQNANDQNYLYGMAKAYTFVQALYRAGKNPTRASLENAVIHLSVKNPFLLPGVNITTTPTSRFPISSVRLVRYQDGHFTEFGKLVKAR